MQNAIGIQFAKVWSKMDSLQTENGLQWQKIQELLRKMVVLRQANKQLTHKLQKIFTLAGNLMQNE